MCCLKGYARFSAVLVRNKVSILAILVSNRIWLLHFNLELESLEDAIPLN